MPPSLRCSSLWAAPSVSAHFRLTGSDPLVLGAALYGWGMGCWLGLVFGAVVLLSGDAGLFLAADPGGAIVTVLSKGIACAQRRACAAGGCTHGIRDVPFCCRLWPPRWSIRGCFCWAVPAHWRSPVAWAASWRPCAAGRPSTTRICCCVACGSSAPLTAHRQISPEKRSRYKRRLGTTSPQPPFFCPTTGRAGLTERTPAPPMRRR